jgi:hypothetical protein
MQAKINKRNGQLMAERAAEWRPVLAPEQAATAVSMARTVVARLWEPEDVDADVTAAQQTSFPKSVHWLPYGVAQGDAAMAVMYGYLHECFPDEDRYMVGHQYLTLAGRGAEALPYRPAGLWAGLSGLAFATWYLSHDGVRYRRLLATVEEMLFPDVIGFAGWVAQQKQGVSVSQFDVISGLSGIGAYLLCRQADAPAAAALTAVVRALIELCGKGDGRPRWHTLASVIGDESMLHAHPYGKLNCGLTHCIPGLLALLALTQLGGIEVEGLAERSLGLAGEQPKSLQGIVSQPDGTPLAGIAVRLSHQGLRGETVAGATRSGADSSFSLPWPDGITAGLTVRADGGGGKAVSSTVTSAAGTAWVCLSVGGESRSEPQCATLMAAVTPRLDNVPIHTVGDDDRPTELQVISEATGVPETEVSRLVLAYTLTAETRSAAAVFFALFAQRIPAVLTSALAPGGAPLMSVDDAQVPYVLDTILQRRSDNVRAALQAAVDDPTIATIGIDAAATQLHALRIKAIGARPLRVGQTSFRDVLATAITDPVAQERVYDAFAAHGTSADFWTEFAQADHACNTSSSYGSLGPWLRPATCCGMTRRTGPRCCATPPPRASCSRSRHTSRARRSTSASSTARIGGCGDVPGEASGGD